MTSGSSTICRARIRGFSERMRILKDDLHVAASFAQPPARNAEHVLAAEPHRSPEVGSINRMRQRPVVVLPLPDSPTRPNVSPPRC